MLQPLLLLLALQGTPGTASDPLDGGTTTGNPVGPGWEVTPLDDPLGGLRPPSRPDRGDANDDESDTADGSDASNPNDPSTPGGGPTTPTTGDGSGPRSGPVPTAPTPAQVAPAPSLATRATSALTDGDTDRGHWRVWWRLHREPYLAVTPWERAPTSGDSPAAEGGLARATVFGRIRPALEAALADDPSAALRAALLLALARVGDEEGGALGDSTLQRALRQHLGDANQRVAETACIALGVLGRPDALPTLGALLEGARPGQELVGGRVSRRQQTFAAYGIGLIAGYSDNPDVLRYATRTLVTALERESGGAGRSSDVRVAVLIALGAIDAARRPVEENDRLAEHALELLRARRADADRRAQVPGLLARLARHTSEDVREEVLDLLTDLVARRSERDAVRQACVVALGRLGDRDADATDRRVRAVLMDVASGGDQRLRPLALMALARVGARPGDAGLAGTGHPVAGAKDAARFLVRRLARAKSRDEAWNALALGVLARGMRDAGEMPPNALFDALRDGLRGASSPDERAAYALALGLARDTGALRALVELLEDSDPVTRADVATALGLLGAPAAIEPLRRTLRAADHLPGLLADTTRALAVLHDHAVTGELDGLAAGCACGTTTRALAVARGRTRHAAAVEPLLALLAERGAPELDRAYAAVGLGSLAEKELAPWTARLSLDQYVLAAPATLVGSGGGILDLP